MTVAQGQFTIFEHIDGRTPVLGEDYFPAPYVANIIWQYYLSDSVKVLSPTTETTITFDDGTTATVGTWIDIVSESAIPIVKGLINGVETTYYRFRRQKYIMSDHTEENPHIKYSSEHLDETDQRILEWCSATDSLYMDGSRIAARSIVADKIDTSTLIVGENIQMGSNAKISWVNVTDKDSVALKDEVSTAKSEAISAASSDATNKANAAKSGAISEIEGKGYQNASQVTQITKNTITTEYVNALGITASAMHIKNSEDHILLEAGGNKVTIGGWDITENGIEKDSVVGMLSATGSCRSDDKTSSPRFYAGADMATYGDNWGDYANFLVLEDGSLYAKNVVIEGDIEATGGFNGTVEAKAGSSLGNFKVYEDSIAGSNIQLLDGDNTIKAERLSANKIETHDGSKECFAFDISGTTEQYVTVSVQIEKDIYNEDTGDYYSHIGVELSVPPTRDYKFLVFIYYDYDDIYHYEDHIEREIVIKAGSLLKYGGCAFDETYKFRAFLAEREFTRCRIELVGEGITLKTSAETLNETFEDACKQSQSGILNIHAGGHIVPTHWGGDGTGWNLGEQWKMWNNIYAYTTAIQSSDRQVKKDIEFLSDPYEQIFDALEPVSYKFIKNTSDRTHTGFIAQDVKAAVENAGLTTQDFAAYCEWENDDGTTGCGLRYGEFIALCVNEIQKLKKRVAELEEKLDNTK